MVYVKVADEVWVTCALLHRENPDRPDFSTREIVDRVAREDIYGSLRPGVIIHVNQHCVANRRPNPGNYRILYETRRGYRRLFREGDDYHPYRNGGKIRPEKNDLPEEYRHFIDWYDNEYNR